MKYQSKKFIGAFFITSVSFLALNQNVLADCIRDNPDKYGFDAQYRGDSAKMTIKTSKATYECNLSEKAYRTDSDPTWKCNSDYKDIKIQTGKRGYMGINTIMKVYANGEEHRIITKIDPEKCFFKIDDRGNTKVMVRPQYQKSDCNWNNFKTLCNADHQLMKAESTYTLKEKKEKELSVIYERKMGIYSN